MTGANFVSSAGEKIRARVADLRGLLRRQEREAEMLTHLPQATVQALHESGAYKMGHPVEFGGYALGATDQARIFHEVGRGDGAAAWSLSVASVDWFVLAYPNELVKEFFAGDWVGPRLAGATFSSSHTVGKARQVEGGWMVKGRWSFGSNVRHSRYFGAGVQFEDGSPERGPGASRLDMFTIQDDGSPQPMRGQVLLTPDQYKILDDWHVMGLMGTGSNSVLVENEVFVPAHRAVPMPVLGAIVMGDLSDRYDGLLWKINRMITLGLSGGAAASGIARTALESFIEQAKQRSTYGTAYAKMADAPSVQIVAAKAQAMISAAERLVFAAAEQVDRRGIEGVQMGDEEMRRLSFESTYALNLCDEAVGLLQKTLGSSSAALSNPVQKCVRDIRVMSLHGGMRFDFNAEHHGRALFGLPPMMAGM